jgi:putative DNA primase/helicase
MKAGKILEAFGAVDDDNGNGYRAFCPVHEADNDGHKPSLLISFTDDKKALILCESRGCTVEDIVIKAGISMRDLFNVSYIGQSVRSARAGGKAPAADEVRRTTAAKLYVAARDLSDHLDDEPLGKIATVLKGRYGIEPTRVNSEFADGLGLGLDDDGWLTIAARTGTESVAFVQARNPDPDAEMHWTGLKNPDDGTRWDAAGFIGRRHKNAPVIVTEGMSDALTVAVLDRYDVVAVRGAKLAARISEVANDLIGRVVVIVFDNDAAGNEGRDVLITKLESVAATLKVAELPPGDIGDYRDADPVSFVQRFGDLVDAAEVYEPVVDFDFSPYDKEGGGTDAGRAGALVAYARQRGFDLAYTDSYGWMLFDGSVWNPRAEQRVRQLSHALGRYLRDQADQQNVGNKDKADRMRRIGRMFLTTGAIDRALREAGAMPDVWSTAADFDADRDIVGVGNGIVDLRTGELRPASVTDKITRRLAVNYQPDAEAPKWEKFLADVFVDEDGKTDPELVSYMQQLIGYGLTGHTSEHMFAILSGNGGNGKSSFVNVLMEVMSAVAKSTPFSTFEEKPAGSIPNDLAALKSARLVVAQEGRRVNMNESMLKSVCGEDTIDARFMRQEWFSFKPQFLVLLVSNHLPKFMGQEDGLWRKVRLIEFRRKFRGRQQVRGLADTIVSEEATGVLAWIVEGAKAWYANGRRLPETAVIDDAGEWYRRDSDPLGEFLDTHATKTDRKGDVIFHSDLHARYIAQTLAENGKNLYGYPTFSKMLDERWGEAGRSRVRPKHTKFRLMRTPAQVARKVAEERKAVMAEARGLEIVEPTSDEVAEVMGELPAYPDPQYSQDYSFGRRTGKSTIRATEKAS